MNLLSVENITKAYGARVLFQDLSFGLQEGQKSAIVAKNGSGKTTILKILAGKDQADSGIVSYRKGVKVSYLPQEPELDESKNLIDNVLAEGHPATDAIKNYEKALSNPENEEAYQKAFDAMDRNDAWDFENQVKQVLGKLGLHDLELGVAKMSGGQRKRLALAKVLIAKPDLLILDEPTNHLDLSMIEWLEEYLSQQSLSLLMVTHDRYFLENICDQILELDQEKLFQHPGSYSEFLIRQSERRSVESVQKDKASNLLRKELEWMRRQPKARGTKSKARIDAFFGLKDKAKVGPDLGQVQMEVQMTRLGSKILELHKLKKNFGPKKILDGFSYNFKKGERIGIIGSNGSGKTTFLNLISSREEIDGGKIVKGDTVKYGYYTQKGISFKPGKRVIDIIKDIAEFLPIGKKGREISASMMLDRFLFSGDQQYSQVEKLSGGEKRRLYLLTVLMANPNFLILDEPTNDLDILTLNVLEEFLVEFNGCLIIVTHDRFFMDKLCDQLFVFKGEGEVEVFPGNYTDYRDKEASIAETEKLRSKSLVKPTAKKKEAQSSEKKTKLTYAEKIEFEELGGKIEELEKRLAAITLEFQDATSDAEALEKLSKESKKIQEELDSSELRWLELSEYNT